MKNFKGGYKIVSLELKDISSGFTLKGLYDALKDSYSKPILVSEIVMSGTKKNDAYTIVNKSGTSYVIEVYGQILTVATTDAVTVATKPEITSIGTGLTLTDGELSAQSGGTLYQHNIRIQGTHSGKSYDFYVSMVLSVDTSFTSITDLCNYIKTKNVNQSCYVANGRLGSDVIICFGVFLEYNTFILRSISSGNTNYDTPEYTSVSTVTDIVFAI